MLTEATFAANDELDRQRIFNVLSGLAGAALGVDPGASPYDANRLTSPTGQHQVFSVTTGTAPQGQAALTTNIGGYSLTLPMLLVVGVAAWFVLRR
jgi:hypothetical protein